MTRIALLIAAAVLAAPAAARSQDDETRTLRSRLRSVRLDVDFKDAGVRDLVDYIRDVMGCNIVLRESEAVNRAKLTIKAKGISVQSLFNLLLKPNGIGFTIEDGVILVQAESEIQKVLKLEIIDVRDLLYPIRDFPGVEITLVDTGLATAPTVNDTPPEFPLVDLIKAHVGGKSWEENSRASIQLMNGLLFVRQTPEVIEQIRRILTSFRQFK